MVGFYESSAWEYSWYAPHDTAHLIQLMGGNVRLHCATIVIVDILTGMLVNIGYIPETLGSFLRRGLLLGWK